MQKAERKCLFVATLALLLISLARGFQPIPQKNSFILNSPNYIPSHRQRIRSRETQLSSFFTKNQNKKNGNAYRDGAFYNNERDQEEEEGTFAGFRNPFEGIMARGKKNDPNRDNNRGGGDNVNIPPDNPDPFPLSPYPSPNVRFSSNPNTENNSVNRSYGSRGPKYIERNGSSNANNNADYSTVDSKNGIPWSRQGGSMASDNFEQNFGRFSPPPQNRPNTPPATVRDRDRSFYNNAGPAVANNNSPRPKRGGGFPRDTFDPMFPPSGNRPNMPPQMGTRERNGYYPYNNADSVMPDDDSSWRRRREGVPGDDFRRFSPPSRNRPDTRRLERQYIGDGGDRSSTGPSPKRNVQGGLQRSFLSGFISGGLALLALLWTLVSNLGVILF